jgi:hypothetical protein
LEAPGRRVNNHQIPSTNNQIISNYQYPKIYLLEFGDWVLFEIWDLDIGI